MISICATGDLLLQEHFPDKYDYKEVSDTIKNCDVRITNLETVVSDWNCFASSFCGGQWINMEPEKLNSIAQYNFNLYGCANNHSMDYSFDGLLSTINELKRRNWLFAGIGENLKKSTAPTYLNLKNGKKVAFFSITSTFIDAARAGDSRDEIPGRPGVNPLRVNTKYYVTRKHFLQLKEIAEGTYINGERDNARKIGSLPPEDGSLNFGGLFFAVSDNETESKFTYCNKNDLNRMKYLIEKASKETDLVIVSVHSHQIKRNEYNEPDYFLEEFAHECIDSGADAIIGGGTHQLKPIEIYKNRPIFYSLGNFVFEVDKVYKLPADFWDKYNYPEYLSVQEGMNRKTKNGTIGLEKEMSNYLSIIPKIVYTDDREVKSIELIPIELNFNNNTLKGLPRIAESKEADLIFKEISKSSLAYSTIIKKTENGKMFIDLTERG